MNGGPRGGHESGVGAQALEGTDEDCFGRRMHRRGGEKWARAHISVQKMVPIAEIFSAEFFQKVLHFLRQAKAQALTNAP